MSDYMDAVRNLNEAAYAAIRAGSDTTRYPLIDRQALREIARETDRLVDMGEESGARPPAKPTKPKDAES